MSQILAIPIGLTIAAVMIAITKSAPIHVQGSLGLLIGVTVGFGYAIWCAFDDRRSR